MRARTIGLAAAAVGLALFTNPGAAQSVNVSDLFGSRVHLVAGALAPLARGDFDGDGKVDQVFYVSVEPNGDGKSLASDVHVIDKLFDGQPFGPKAAARGLAITMKGGAQKFLVVDVQSEGVTGFFESPSWAALPAQGNTSDTVPVRSERRGSRALKGYPCLGKSGKGDVIVISTESGVDFALPWTGTTFKRCENPNDEP